MRRFEYLDDKSAKFWEIEQSDTDVNLRWGRIGTAGQSQTKNFATGIDAEAAMLKLIGEKLRKGYVEPGLTAGAPAAGAPATAAPAKAAPVKSAPAKAAPAKAAKPAAEAVEAEAPAARTTAAAPSTLPTPAAPAESVDQQVDRAFEALRAQIADGTFGPKDGALTAAKIRRTFGIGEFASDEVVRHLIAAGLIRSWSLETDDSAKTLAAAMADESAPEAAPAAPAATAAGDLRPWLAAGTPLRLGGAGNRTRSLARATRRHPHPVVLAEPAQAWEYVRGRIAGRLSADLAGSAADVRDLFEAVWKSLDLPAPDHTPQTDALLTALALDMHHAHSETIGPRFVDYLVARHGLAAALNLRLDALHYRIEEEYTGNGHNLVRVTHNVAQAAGDNGVIRLNEGHWRLRAHLAAAPQAVYDACAAGVKERMATLGLADQAGLALLFPDLPDMAHDLVARLEAEGGELPYVVKWLQLNVTDLAVLARLRHTTAGGHGDFCHDENMVATILLEHGIDAVHWLAPGAAQDAAGEALARIGTPEALEPLARAAGSGKPALARLTLAVQRWPAAAAAALARVLGGPTKDGSLLMPALVDLVRNHPSLPADLQQWLEPAANRVLASVHELLAGPSDVAVADELPEVLADVPWLRAKKKAASPLQLAPLPLAPVEQWDDDKQEDIDKVNAWYRKRYRDALESPADLPELLGFRTDKKSDEYVAARAAARDAIAERDVAKLLAAWRTTLALYRKDGWSSYSLDGNVVTFLPPEFGIPFWNAAAADCSCEGVEHVAATWGVRALPGVVARIAAAPTEYLYLAQHLGVVELAPVAARAFVRLKSMRALGRKWLARYPEHAACGLIAPALGKLNEARDCAAAALRYLTSIGHMALIEEVAGRYGKPEVLPALHAMLNESPLDRFPSKRPALPEFWKPTGWRRPVLHNGKALPNDALEALGAMMTFPTNEEVYAGLYQVKAACKPQSLADFAWDCFSAWLNSGAPNKEVWTLHSLGTLGTDDTARKLTALVRTWPGEGAHARAVTGLDVLATMGSDVALMLLNGVAQKVKFKGLQDKAREKIAAIAEARGLSPEELADRLAPDLGLDDGGSMVLDFGPRAFKVGFDEALKPYVREWADGRAGARLPDLPKPKKTDDEALSNAAVERFKALKKDARTVASQQVLRLERAMCARRRWTPAVFSQFLADHPLVRHLVRRLVWGVYAMPATAAGGDGEPRFASHGGELADCFRVAEDGEYTTAADDPFTLPEGDEYRIGLPHALEMSPEQAAGFGQLFADYELLQPFQQLGRDTHALTAEELAAAKLLRWKGVKVPTGKVLGLVNIGWHRAETESGVISMYGKTADAARSLELTLDPGVILGMVEEYPEQTLGEITLGPAGRSIWDKDDDLSTFDTLDAIVASELIRDMERLRS